MNMNFKFKGFPCRICKKKVKEQFSYTREYSEKYGNKPCSDCGKISKWVVELADNFDRYNRKYVSCLECNPVMNDTENIWYTDRVCRSCFFEWKGKRRQNGIKKDDLSVKLIQENQELRQQLSEVQKQLAEVLEELKNLKRDLNDKDSEKLEQEIVKSERLIKDGEKVSVSEVQEQVNKSQALMKEFKNASAIFPTKSSEERKRNNSHLKPYLLGGLVIIFSGLIFMVGLLVGKKQKKREIN